MTTEDSIAAVHFCVNSYCKFLNISYLNGASGILENILKPSTQRGALSKCVTGGLYAIASSIAVGICWLFLIRIIQALAFCFDEAVL